MNKIHTNTKKYLVSLPLIIASCLILIGCGSGADGKTTRPTINISTPEDVATAQLPSGTLKSYYKIDGGDKIEASLTNNLASIELSNFTDGEHTVVVTFEYTTEDGQVITLATATKTFQKNFRELVVNVNDIDFTFPDDDEDGITNLASLVEISISNNCVLDISSLDKCNLG